MGVVTHDHVPYYTYSMGLHGNNSTPGDTATPTLARANAIAHVMLLPWSPKPRPKPRPLRHHYVIKYTRPSPIFQRVTLKNTEKAWGRGYSVG